MKKILVTGGAGYLGSVLCTNLLNFGYKVTVIDNLLYNKESLLHLMLNKNFKFIKGDVLNKKLMLKEIKGKDFIIPLAALVGAPLCKKFPKKAKQVNFDSIDFLINKISKNQKIIYPNTNSGYGISDKKSVCDENSLLKPISIYGKTKVDAEKKVLSHKNSIVFRLATVFGYSYRMRTDLLVNFYVSEAIKMKKINIYEPKFRRNYIHVTDIAKAFIFAITNFNKMKGNIYNLGLSSANLTKLDLVKKIKKQMKYLKIKIVKNKKDPDKRDYFVSNKKIEKLGFYPDVDIDSGITELIKVFSNNKFEKNLNNYNPK
jgi:nucleoside-diphosphate-sugar epimerase